MSLMANLPALGSLVLFLIVATPTVACDYPGGPPDARVVRVEGPGVNWAYYSNATEGYGHGVLGDKIEARALRVMTSASGPCDTYAHLGQDAVFEDINPRIADVTGDGLNDVVVVETRFDAGASLAVYGMSDGGFQKLAATPYIGRPYRWLAPAGIADFDGDGVEDVAYVQTPHIGGVLQVWSFRGNEPRRIAADPGYSNHRIGEGFITGGVRDCGDGPQLVLPDATWSRTLLARVTNGTIESTVLAKDTTSETIVAALECRRH